MVADRIHHYLWPVAPRLDSDILQLKRALQVSAGGMDALRVRAPARQAAWDLGREEVVHPAGVSDE
jgi:hypothetical protein